LGVLGLSVLAVLVYLGLVRVSYPTLSRYPVRGIDVSHHQETIDWNAVANAKLRFVFIKATEGGDHRDQRFEENWRGAAEAGIHRGAYHFFTFCTPGLEQAENFLATVPNEGPRLPPAVDVEFTGNCRNWTSTDDIRTQLSVFLERVEAAGTARPILYVTQGAYDRILAGLKAHLDEWLAVAPLASAPTRPLTHEDREALRQLGYIE